MRLHNCLPKTFVIEDNDHIAEHPAPDIVSVFLFFSADAYTTRDIIYEWVLGATEVVVGNTEMAQFEYKGSKLKSGVVVVDTG